MKTNNPNLEEFRRVHPLYGSGGVAMMGYFAFPISGKTMTIISSGPSDWEHVSCSFSDRCPTWEDMCKIKDLFWNNDECVVQFHPPRKNYKNLHKYCLHLWKPPFEIELPEIWRV